jgi:hypothetical protein
VLIISRNKFIDLLMSGEPRNMFSILLFIVNPVSHDRY